MFTPNILVAFEPLTSELGDDRLFYGESYCHFGDASHWLEPTKVLAQRGRCCGIEFHTADVVNLEDAAVFIFGDMPASPDQVKRLRQDYPHLKIVLHILESPLRRDWIFDRRNHSYFDAVVSYNPELDDGVKHTAFKLPAGGLGKNIPPGAPWEDRKIACMLAQMQNVHPIRSGLGLIRRGWKFSQLSWWNYITASGSLYREKVRIARQCEDTLAEQFDIFGPYWPMAKSGGNHGKVFRSARGTYKGSKLDLLPNYRFTIAYENCLNDCGYISEKLFDALLAGCVPVYLGNKSIAKYVPETAFVDARKFNLRRDLAIHLREMPRERWLAMRCAGSAFLRDEAVGLFGSEQYAAAVIKAVQQVMSAASAVTR